MSFEIQENPVSARVPLRDPPSRHTIPPERQGYPTHGRRARRPTSAPSWSCPCRTLEPEPACRRQSAPVENQVGVDSMRPRDRRDRRSFSQRLFDNLTLGRDRDRRFFHHRSLDTTGLYSGLSSCFSWNCRPARWRLLGSAAELLVPQSCLRITPTFYRDTWCPMRQLQKRSIVISHPRSYVFKQIQFLDTMGSKTMTSR